ncbi:DUF853 domain-containing protein [Streptomyces sp. SAJ15]|uniref:DUF853 domain-containing protein n=1 Tax=Streptomyces sp. SAJ15 TaxID=2011095 RepID=UPI0021B4A52B|nr:DUF853 domain-containing protein [Streptomyces sp. SAJ15]
MNESPPSATERSPRAPRGDVPRRIAEGYPSSGPALDLGAPLWDKRGAPTPVAAVRLRAPRSRMGPIEPAELERAVTGSALLERYAQAVDRDSAYEKLAAAGAAKEAATTGAASAGRGASAGPGAGAGGGERRARREREPRLEPETLVDQVVGGGILTTLARSVDTRRGGEISRSLFGTARRRGR